MRHLFLLLLPFAAACSSSADQPGAADAAPGSDSSAGDASSADAAPEAAGSTCTAALAELLHPSSKSSTGDVSFLPAPNGVKTIYVDASAGGAQIAENNPRVYISLDTGSRIDISDIAAASSTAWDLALKRSVLFTNDGAAGPGQGGTAHVNKAFDAVTLADANALVLGKETFVDADCNPLTDAVGDVTTTLSGWYDYDSQAHTLSPHAGTYVVRGGSGKLFKLAIVSYYATLDGGVNAAGGYFSLQVAAL